MEETLVTLERVTLLDRGATAMFFLFSDYRSPDCFKANDSKFCPDTG